MADTEIRWCKHCGSRFEVKLGKRGRSHYKIYCSDKCRKARWQKENRWKRQDVCPSCGGLKEMKSNFCKNCMRPNNPTGFRGHI